MIELTRESGERAAGRVAKAIEEGDDGAVIKVDDQEDDHDTDQDEVIQHIPVSLFLSEILLLLLFVFVQNLFPLTLFQYLFANLFVVAVVVAVVVHNL